MGGVFAKIITHSGVEQLASNERELEDIEIFDIDGNIIRIGDLISDKKAVMFVNVATR